MGILILVNLILVLARGKTPGKTYTFIGKYQKISGNTLKYQKIPVNFRRYKEISGKNTKSQEIQDHKHEILGNNLFKTRNTLVFLRDSCST
jgi:acid phosphatase class B